MSGAEVLYRLDDKSELKGACKTNPKGRCIVKFSTQPSEPIGFVIKKEGFQIIEKTATVTHKGNISFNIEKGLSVSIFALTKTFNYSKGLEGVSVFVNGKPVGKTDKSGHLAYGYNGKMNDLLTISMRPQGYLPEDFETDFVVSGSLKLVRYFTPTLPPPAKLTLLKANLVGTTEKTDLKMLDQTFQQKSEKAIRSHILQNSLFEEFPATQFLARAKKQGKTSDQVIKNGWQDTPLKAVLDGVILPSLILDKKNYLELSVIDSRGRTLSAAQEPLEQVLDDGAIDRAVKALAAKIVRKFPFEGAVLSRKGDQVTTNLGKSSGRGLQVGDQLDVFGIQSGAKGQSQIQKLIGTLIVTDVTEIEAHCKIKELSPRSSIARGDLVVLRYSQTQKPAVAKSKSTAPTKPASSLSAHAKQTKQTAPGQIQIHVAGSKDAPLNTLPIPQANIYLADNWLGATDGEGNLALDQETFKDAKKSLLKVVKYGYKATSKEFSLSEAKKTPVEIPMERETAFLRVESKPEGATVKLDGAVVGKTPLISPIAVPTGFAKLTLEGLPGYKNYDTILDLDQGTFDLTGASAIALEEDFRGQAKKMMADGKLTEAIAKLESIPETHTDYLMARYDIGEIYLTKTKEPAKAAGTFARVTSSPTVKNFNDKRFIGAHINEGIALFFTAENLAKSDSEAAKAHYQKAIEVLSKVQPQLRFVSKEQYGQAIHNVSFYRALAYHKLWNSTKDPALLTETVRAWRDYLDGTVKAIPPEEANKAYVENAKVYFGQAKAQLASIKGTTTE